LNTLIICKYLCVFCLRGQRIGTGLCRTCAELPTVRNKAVVQRRCEKRWSVVHRGPGNESTAQSGFEIKGKY